MAVGFLGGHAEAYRVYLMNSKEVELEELSMQSGSVNGNTFRDVPWGADVTIKIPKTTVNWLTARVGIRYIAKANANSDGEPEIDRRMLVGIPARVVAATDPGYITLELLDKCVILLQDEISEGMSFAAGTVVTTAVDTLIRSTGESKVAITPSTLTLRTAMTFPAGTPKLRMVNALLLAIGHATITVDGSGTFVSAQYKSPDERPNRHDFRTNSQAVHDPEIEEDRDLLDIPNQVVCLSTSDGTTEGLSAVAQNTDPNSDYSVVNRGRVVSRTEENVDAASQEVLNKKALDLLKSSASVTWRQTIRHLPLSLVLDDAVFNPTGHVASVVEMRQTLRAGEMTATVIRRFDNLL